MKEKIIIYVSLSLICLISFIYIFNNGSEKVEIESIRRTISVDIKGAVLNPGVKTIEKGSTISDLIELSGGLLDTADTSTINLSKQLDDEMVVIVYTKDEIKQLSNGNNAIKVVEKECYCPVISNSGCITEDFTKVEQTNKISLNKATKEELMTLKNIGSTKADAIIEYRETHEFKKIEELMNIKGIGQATFEKIKDNITI